MQDTFVCKIPLAKRACEDRVSCIQIQLVYWYLRVCTGLRSRCLTDWRTFQ